MSKERERDRRLLLDAAARPIDRAGDVRLDSGALTAHADLKPQVVLRVHVWQLLLTQRSEMSARRRDVRAGRYESSPCSMKRGVGVDRARDVDLRGPGDAPPDYRGARQRALLSTTNSKPGEMRTTTAGM